MSLVSKTVGTLAMITSFAAKDAKAAGDSLVWVGKTAPSSLAELSKDTVVIAKEAETAVSKAVSEATPSAEKSSREVSYDDIWGGTGSSEVKSAVQSSSEESESVTKNTKASSGGFFDGLTHGVKSFFDSIGDFFGDIGGFFKRLKGLVYHPADAVASDTKGMGKLVSAGLDELSTPGNQAKLATLTGKFTEKMTEEMGKRPEKYLNLMRSVAELGVQDGSMDTIIKRLFQKPGVEEEVTALARRILKAPADTGAAATAKNKLKFKFDGNGHIDMTVGGSSSTLYSRAVETALLNTFASKNPALRKALEAEMPSLEGIASPF